MSSGHVEQMSTVIHSYPNGATSTHFSPLKPVKHLRFAFGQPCPPTHRQSLPSNFKLSSTAAINSNHSSANIRVNLLLPSLWPLGQPLAQQPAWGSTHPPKTLSLAVPGGLLDHRADQKPSPGTVSSSKKDSLYRYMQQIDGTPQHRRCLKALQTLDWGALSVPKFIYISTKDLVWTSALQKFLNMNSLIDASVEKLVLQTMPTLFYDKFGCHILRIMVKKSTEVLKHVYELAFQTDFDSVCTHESGCKVLQAACEADAFTRAKCLRSVLAHWDDLKQSIYTFYLFTVCLKLTESSSQEFGEVYQFLLSRCDNIFKGKYDKRFLVSFVECCREEQLPVIYSSSQLEKNLSTRGRDKYVIFIFLTFVSRGLRRAKDHYKHLLKHPTATTSRIERMASSIKKTPVPAHSQFAGVCLE
jgi:hypothetical protein